MNPGQGDSQPECCADSGTDASHLATLVERLSLANGADDAFDRMCRQLDAWVAGMPRPISRENRQLRRVLIHTLYLLREGDRILDLAWQEHWDEGITFFLEAVARIDGNLRRVTAQVSIFEVQMTVKPFDVHLGVPSVLCWVSDMTVKALAQPAGRHQAMRGLCDNEYAEFFRNHKAIHQRIRRRSPGLDSSHTVFMRAQADFVRSELLRLYPAVPAMAPSARAGESATHPYLAPTLQVLPRLVLAGDQPSILGAITSQLPRMAEMGFGALLLGVVDPQTVDLYYGELADKSLSPAYNDHGYWSTGEAGVDPFLGTAAEYAGLVRSCRELGMAFIQDSVFGSLGYPAQIQRFTASTLQSPLSCVVLGNAEVDAADPLRFIHDGEWSMGNCGRLASDLLEEMAAMQLGTCWSLPKPNLYDDEVMDDVLARAGRQSRDAHVGAFRVDMAKHIPTRELRRIVGKLRAMGRGSDARFAVLLEYLSTDYRVLAMALAGLENEAPNCYLYDFPLAAALHRIFVDGQSMHEQVLKILSERALSGMALRALVPTFIDHDTTFTPVYAGDQRTQAAVVAAYALALVLSANAPVIFMGFADPRAGRSADAGGNAGSGTRHAVTDIFGDDPLSPAIALAALFKAVSAAGIVERWDSTDIVCEELEDGVRVRRHYLDPAGERRGVEALVTRGRAPLDGEDAIFRYDGVYSVRLWHA